MKLHSTFFTISMALVLTACSMTLAEDVTPPPGAVQAPQATHAPVFPENAPDLANGEVIYAEKCAACHGERGMGDGPQAEQLQVPVAALGAPELAAAASPADWFLTVTLGNIDKFMPPFASLSDQERWDVVAYALSLSTSEGQVARGKALFEANCAGCPTAPFSDQATMAALSGQELVGLLVDGGEGLPPFGASLSDEERQEVAAYLRSLSFAAPAPTPQPATSTPMQAATPSESPAGEGAPAEGTPEAAEATPEASTPEGIGTVSGKILNGSGGAVPAGLTVRLYGFDHNTEADAAPQQVVDMTVEAGADGTFRFDDVEIPEGRIFYAEVDYKGVPFQSELTFTEAGLSDVLIPDVTIYESTTETGALVTEELFVFFEFNSDGTVRIFEQFYISNQGDRVVLVDTDGITIPILPVPAGVADLAFQPTQDSAALLPTESGFAMPPSDSPYGIIAFYTLPYDKKLALDLPFALPVASISVVVPEGIKVASDQLEDGGLREMQPGVTFQIYSGGILSADESLRMTLSGKVKTASGTSLTWGNPNLLIGIGALGVALILAGAWLYLRDRHRDANDLEAEEVEGDGFESSEEVMDAIIALDDLHRAGKIPDEAYQARRAELKEKLKDLV